MVEPMSPADKHQHIHHAVDLLMNNQFNDAKQYFTLNQSSDVKLQLAHSLLLVIQAISTHSDDYLTDALSFIWKTEYNARSLSDSPSINRSINLTKVEGLLIQADTHLLGSMIQMIQQSFVKVAWNVRKSHQFYAKASTSLDQIENELSINPSNDPSMKHRISCLRGWQQFGSGLFSLLLSLLPPTVMKIAEWVGYSGDRDTALALLRQSQQSESFMAPFAALMMCLFYLTIAQFTGQDDEQFLIDARSLLDWGSRSHPNGAFFALLESRYYRAKVQPQKAIDIAQAGLRSLRELPALGIMYIYQSAWCAMFLLDWSQAAKHFGALLYASEDSEDEEQVALPPTRASAQAFYAYQLGLCQAMQGNWDAARQTWLSVPEWLQARDKPIDKFAVLKSSQLLARLNQSSLTTDDVLLDVLELIVAWNGITQMPSEYVQQATEMLRNAYVNQSNNNGWSAEQLVRYRWLKASFIASAQSTDQSNVREAQELLTSTLNDFDKDFKRDKSVMSSGLYAFICLELAHNAFVLQQHSQAKDWLVKANKQTGYELSNILHFKTHALGQKIKRAEQQ